MLLVQDSIHFSVLVRMRIALHMIRSCGVPVLSRRAIRHSFQGENVHMLTGSCLGEIGVVSAQFFKPFSNFDFWNQQA